MTVRTVVLLAVILMMIGAVIWMMSGVWDECRAERHGVAYCLALVMR